MDGKNTDLVLARLTQHKMIGELYRDIHIQVYRGGSYDDTINIGMWLVVGEDSKLRIYADEQHELMYRPIVVERETDPAGISESIPKCTLHIAGSYSLVATHSPVYFDLVGVECLLLTDFLKARE